jgi:hypothetical protein
MARKKVVGDERNFDTEPLRGWIKRQQHRLLCDGTSFGEWCEIKGIPERAVRESLTRPTLSYDRIDQILTPAGYRVEDLYGWD